MHAQDGARVAHANDAITAPTPTDQAGRGTPAARPGGRPVPWHVRAKFWLVRKLLWAWARAFSLKGLYLLGAWFGTLEYLINFKRRARCRAQLGRVFPEGVSRRRQRAIIRGYFRRTRCDKLLYLIFDRLPREKIMKRIKFRGREHLEAALRRESGVYVLLSHHGSHHVAGLLMALCGFRCAGIRDPNEGALRAYMQQKYAERFPEFAAIRVLYADSFPREIFRCFRGNYVVGSALDIGRDRGAELKTCPVRMFGQTREFLTGTLQIALRCGATIVQGFVVSRPNFYFRLICSPALHDPVDRAEADDDPLLAAILQRYADGIAEHVRAHPDHLSRI